MSPKRQRARQARTEQFWARRRATAATVAARAAVAWDRLRSTLADVPAPAADAAWAVVEDHLLATEREIRTANFAAPGRAHAPEAEGRAGAREASTPAGHGGSHGGGAA